jgi:hypothetical protein
VGNSHKLLIYQQVGQVSEMEDILLDVIHPTA